jgi:hypothetical protein
VQRAGIFIGVNQTGNLPRLNDAAASATRLHAWAVSQGMIDGVSAVLITDDTSPVTPDQLIGAVEKVIAEVAPEQLIVYFAGHGVVLRRSEQWLLTNAPQNANHAIDLKLSAEMASFGTVPHVVLISDACRTAPEGIQAQSVLGGSIFPNVPSDEQRNVDIYYACGLGRPAAEIQDARVAVGSYRGVYTEVLLDALRGDLREPFKRMPPDHAWYAGVRRLRDVLTDEVPRRIRAKRLKARYSQTPYAQVVSDDDVWLARLEKLPRAKPAATRPAKVPASKAPAKKAAGRPPRPEGPPRAAVEPHPPRAPSRGRVDIEIARSAREVATPFGPDHFETQCGVKVRGTSIADQYVVGMEAEPIPAADSLRLQPTTRAAASLVLKFADGSVTMLPVLAEYIAALTFEDGELLSVAYEPSINSWRAEEYRARAREIRKLRALAAAASAVGRFELEEHEGGKLARQMQYAKGVDPALAVYAAYAYYERHDIERIHRMSSFLENDVGVTFFDLEMLSRHLVDKGVRPDDGILPCVPLLSQGWSLMRAHRVSLPDPIRDVDELAKDSLWSLYEEEAFDKFRRCLVKGLVR